MITTHSYKISLVNVLADTHIFVMFYQPILCLAIIFFYIKVLNVLFTTFLAKIYLVVTIKICLEFAKRGQSTNKNKPQLSLSTNFGMVHIRMTTIFKWF